MLEDAIEKVILFIVGGFVLLTIAGAVIVNMWPTIISNSANVTETITGTDIGSNLIRVLWPFIVAFLGIGVAVGLIIYFVKKIKGF